MLTPCRYPRRLRRWRRSPREAGPSASRSTLCCRTTRTCTSTGRRPSPSSASVRPRRVFAPPAHPADDVTALAVFVSAFAMEGFDRADLHLWNDGDRLIETVAAHCADTVVVIHAPGPVLMESWVSRTLCPSRVAPCVSRRSALTEAPRRSCTIPTSPRSWCVALLGPRMALNRTADRSLCGAARTAAWPGVGESGRSAVLGASLRTDDPLASAGQLDYRRPVRRRQPQRQGAFP